MDGKSLRIIRPKIEVEPYGITLPLKSGGFIKIEDEENVPYPSGFEEVVSMPCRPTSDSEDSGISDEMEFFKPARKRQRLEHLSTEEKVARRKLRNRVAAQTARDKKKARLDHLEIVVRGLQQKNEMLQKENRQLWEANKQLMEENSHLVQTNEKLVRIEESFCTKSTKHSSPKTSSFESAERTGRSQWGHFAEHSYFALPPSNLLHCRESSSSEVTDGSQESGNVTPQSNDRLSPFPDDVCDSLLQWLMQSVEESTETTRCVDVFTEEIDESPDFLDFLAEKPSVDILDPVIHHSDVDDSPVVNGNILMNGNPIKVHSTEYNNSIPDSIHFDVLKEKNLDLFEFLA